MTKSQHVQRGQAASSIHRQNLAVLNPRNVLYTEWWWKDGKWKNSRKCSSLVKLLVKNN